MRVLLLAVAGVAFVGCTFGANTCSSDKPCGAGATCDVSGFCVEVSDSGMGGGGGGSIGGGGGSIGGGGGTVECAGGCMDWQTCQPGNGGVCRNAAVNIVSPMSGALYGGGTSARVVARVTDWDGGLFPRPGIPASATTGVTPPTTMSRDDAGLFVGDFGLPPVAGRHTLTAGWAAANATVDVVTQVCNVACSDWQECLPDADGGTCGDLGLTLTWVTPTEDFTYAPNTTVPLNLTVARTDGGAFTKPVPFTVTAGTAGTLTPNAGSWTGSVASGATDARRELVAGWTGGPMSGMRHFKVDASPPVLGLVVASDGGAFQRDAVIPAVLTSNEGVADAGVALGGVAMARLSIASCPNFGSVTDAVACFQLDFSQPVLNALDGGFAATLSATDLYTNTGPGDGGVLPVTRVRWQRPVSADPLRAAPALGSDGTLYLGSANGADNGGTIFALAPTGNTKAGWTDAGSPVGAVQGIAVANTAYGEAVFFAANNSASRGILGARQTSDGSLGSLLQPEFQGGASSRTYSGIGLMSVDLGAVTGVETVAVATIGVGTDALPAAYRAGAACIIPGSTGTPNMAAPQVPTATESATNVALDGTTAYFIGRGGRVFSSSLTAGWSTPLEFRVGTNSSASFTGSALFRNFSSAWELALGGGTLPGNLNLMALPGGAFSTITVGSNNRVGMPALLPQGGPPAAFIYAGVDGSPSTIDRFQLNQSTSTPGPQTTGFASAAPVLGANSLGYAVAGDGQLTVFSTLNFASSGGWRAGLPTSGIAASPTLDCVRNAAGVGIAGARVGVLYVASTNGTVTAILVDSPKLDTATSGWPKYQRTAGNAGNTDTSFGLNPGCP